jgi:uncharacterized repeat protein (TIGR01451 family)
VHSQSATDWTWYDPAVFESTVSGLSMDPDGNLWMASGSKLIKYDGVNWVAYDVLDSGLSPSHASPRSIDASLGNKIWMSTFDRVVEYDVVLNQWTVHDPTNSATNLNAFYIKVESPNRIWWATLSRLWEYNGSTWRSYNFDVDGLDISEDDFRTIEIDNTNQKWLTTPSGICIEGGCFTPAGLVRLSDTDTTFFDGPTYGFPDAAVTHVKLDSNQDPWLAYTDFLTQENHYRIYSNGQWSAPVYIPFNGFLYDLNLGKEDEMYLTFNTFIAIGKNGVWDVIPLDTNRVDYVSNTLLTPDNDLYIGCKVPNIGQGSDGTLGFLPNLNYRIRGTLYSDRNHNGTFELFEQTLKDQFVQTSNQDRISFSNNDGDYSMLFVDPGTYTIEGVLPEYHSYSVPVDGQHTVSLTVPDPRSDGNDFGYKPDTTAIDLSIDLTGLNGANPGFQTCSVVNVKNNAPRTIDGEVTVRFDDLLSFVSSDMTPISVAGNQFTFLLEDMDYLEIRSIRLCFSLPPDPGLLGDTLKVIGSVAPIGGLDLDDTNNRDTICQIVTGPYDPNFIEVDPKGIGETGDIPVTTNKLEYTIHFQNVGTDTARNVIISNAIDPELDLMSLKVIGASHAYDLSFIEHDRILQWTFDNIQLPDSISSLTESNGFVKYSLSPARHDIGATFRNKADIFFDFNEPVATNTTVNTLIEEITSIENVDQIGCSYEIHVIDNDLLFHFPVIDTYKIGLYDLSGRLLNSSLVYHSSFQIPLLDFPAGCYVVSVLSDNCAEAKKIFVK